MAVVNRTLDGSEQSKVLPFARETAITSGETGILSLVPFQCVLQAAQLAAYSVESNPNLLLKVNRFIVGQGFTSWNIGSTFAVRDFGVSGVLTSGVSLPAAGSTLLQLMANDTLVYLAGGGSTAAIFGVAGCFVVKPMQDIRVFLGGLA